VKWNLIDFYIGWVRLLFILRLAWANHCGVSFLLNLFNLSAPIWKPILAIFCVPESSSEWFEFCLSTWRESWRNFQSSSTSCSRRRFGH